MVEATKAEEAGATEVEGEKNLSTKITGKIRNVSIAIRRYIYPRVAHSHKRTPTTHLVHLGPAKKKV